MKRSHWIVGAWLLLLIPTLLIGALALQLLGNEQERLAENRRSAARQRATTIAESLDLSVAEVKEGLLASLRRLPGDDLARELEDWRLNNPLVRNVFIWTSDGLQLPAPDILANTEADAFTTRYRSLFSGRRAWHTPQPDRPPAGPGSASPAKAPSSARKELRLLARQVGAPAPAARARGGWLPWFWEDALYLLGWIETPHEQRYGLEVEMMALLARLVTGLPEPPAGDIYALVDGQGRIVHRTGSGELTTDTPQLAAVPIGAGLPHWQLGIYRPAGTVGSSGDRNLQLLSTLLVGCFVAAVLFGGSLLLWQALRHMRDARRKTSFVSNVSHELKTPLTTIRMYAELLDEGRIEEEQKRHRYLQVIVAESQRLTRLVNNVLDFSRLEQRRKRYHLVPLPLAEIVQQVLDDQNMRLQQANLQMVRLLPEDSPAVLADRDAVEQVLLNLLDNAIKYAAQGGELVVELQRAEQSVELHIKDRGPGVPAAQRRRIFDQFHRVANDLTNHRPGCGLGLSIARRLLQDMHGALRYCPRDGGGACFVVVLPAAAKPASQ